MCFTEKHGNSNTQKKKHSKNADVGDSTFCSAFVKPVRIGPVTGLRVLTKTMVKYQKPLSRRDELTCEVVWSNAH